ncbi:glycoside hydrolase family 30 protein [Mariniplasma anaerobium]|uniref:Glycosyl hydrolase n=1 Tax=Mariniplasma anaerobium TaxID=2735436 RepID=A0A7U9XVX5_9MOLU|nr:glycoside hydrolase family 30 protein [Mariniplasma anaerobium]BCR35781.1 glycosyl hydrolase [Mariniplasma anaerobium]
MKHIRTSKYDNERFNIVKEKETFPKLTMELKIDPNKTMQSIIGFGGAFTESSAYNLLRISKEQRLKAIKDYFDPVDGLGYTLGRVSIHGCDFSLNSYLYIDDYDDSLNSFSIKRDQPIIDLINDASAIRKQDIKILASPWTPPFWMKDNNSPIRGGKLLPKYDQIWADYFVKFIKAYEEKGINVFSVTVQNEPMAAQRWDSCIFEADDEARFVKVLGKTFKQHDLKQNIYIWDHNRDQMLERTKAVLKDKEAYKYVYGTAFHWYDQEEFEEVKKTHDAFPEKHLLFTEGCQENGPHLGDYAIGERYGRNMINDFRNYNEGYIDWNLFLDDVGGPNHVNNLCSAPIHIKVFNEEVYRNLSYYYIGHFSKYIMPNAVQIESKGDKDLYYIAFKNPDDSYVVIIQNEKEQDFKINIKGLKKPIEVLSKAHSISTLLI